MSIFLLISILIISFLVLFIIKKFCTDRNRNQNNYLNMESDNSVLNSDELPMDDFYVNNSLEIVNNNSISFISDKKDINCVICLDDIEEGDTVINLRCFHKFHKNCLDDWLKDKPIEQLLCPICDTTVFEK